MAPNPPRVLAANIAHVGWLMNRLNSVRADGLREALSSFNISPRGLGVLLAVRDLPHPVSQQEIAASLVLDQASVAIVAEQLEKEGLIRRDRDPRNRRRYVVELTDAGNRTLTEARAATQRVEESMHAGLTEAETDTLHGLLRRVAAEHGIM